MIVRCPDCRTTYEIAAEKVPESGFKLRCPRCKAVFPVSLGIEGSAPFASAGVQSPRAEASASPGARTRSQTEAPAPPARKTETVSLPEPAGATAAPPVRKTETVSLPEPAGAAAAPPPPAPRSRPRVTDPSLARRMARAMISEMVLNRRSERDEALRSGAVLRRFGPAIVSAHDAYLARVSPDLAPAPRIFREAINEILGAGTRLL